MGNSFLSVWEYFEQECPLICWGNDFLIDSAGAGKFRGGLGNTITIEWYSPGTVVTVTGGRVTHFSPGVAGGGDSGACYGMYIKPDGTGRWEQRNGVIPPEYIDAALFGKFDNRKRPDPNNGSVNNALSQMANFSEIVEKPGIMHVAIGGGTGWGDPLERAVERVHKDVWNELVSIEGAESFYGVVIDPTTLQVNEEATNKKRRELRNKRKSGKWHVPIAHSPLWLK
jgi:N-methylhydantoinase B